MNIFRKTRTQKGPFSYRAWIFVLLTIGLQSCFFNYTTEKQQDFVAPEVFSFSGQQTTPDKWWTVFNDPQLDMFITQALDKNLDVKIGWSRLAESRAVVSKIATDLFPTFDGTLSAEKYRDDFIAPPSSYELGLMAEYEVDLWGRIGESIKSEESKLKASFYDYQVTTLTLSAEITRTWFQLSEAHNQLEILNKQKKSNQTVLTLLNTRFANGQSRSADILRQQQSLEAIEEKIYSAQSTIKILEHQLNILLGHPPQQKIQYTYQKLPQLPSLPEVGLPTELIKRRPDIKSSFQLLKSADSDMAVAISNRYPRINLSATLTTEENNSIDFFDNWIRTLAASLTIPLIDAGQRRAEVQRTQNIKERRLFEYKKMILTAFQEVEDALILEEKQSKKIESLEKQLALSKQTNERLQYEYFNGSDNYIDVLTALNSEQDLEQKLLSSKLMLIEHRIKLYRALAGGFKTKRE